MKIFDSTLKSLEHALDVRLVEHNVLAGNIANADTPAYKPKELDFGAAMRAAQGAAGAETMAATDARHMNASGLAGAAGGSVTELAGSMVKTGTGVSPSFDGNQVDIDRTMVGMAENALQYGASAKAAGKKLAILRYAASDGG